MSNDGGVNELGNKGNKGTLNSPKKDTLFSLFCKMTEMGWTREMEAINNIRFGSSEWLTQNSGVSSNLRDVYFINWKLDGLWGGMELV